MQSLIDRRRLLKASAAAVAAGKLGIGSASAADTVEIDFWNPADDSLGGPIIAQLVESYNSGQGVTNGIKVNNVVVSTSGVGYDKYSTAMASSASPDVVMTYNYSPVVPWVANGFVQPIGDFFPQFGLTEDDFYPVCWQSMTFGGKIYGLFQEVDFDEFYWNPDIHPGDAPTTIDEMDALSAEYTKFDADGNLIQAGLIPWAQGGFSAGGYGVWATIHGARFYDNDARKWTITKEGNTAFLDWYLKYVDMLGGREKADAFVSALPKTFWGDVFLFGKTAFSVQFEAMPNIIIQNNSTLNYKIAHPPVVPGVTNETAMLSSADMFLIPTNAKHLEQAVDFTTFMGGSEGVLEWALPIGQMIANKKDANDPRLFDKQWWYKTYLETLEAGKVLASPLSPQAVVFSTAIGLAIDQVTYKQKSPADALAECEATVLQAVEQFRSANPDWEGE